MNQKNALHPTRNRYQLDYQEKFQNFSNQPLKFHHLLLRLSSIYERDFKTISEWAMLVLNINFIRVHLSFLDLANLLCVKHLLAKYNNRVFSNLKYQMSLQSLQSGKCIDPSSGCPKKCYIARNITKIHHPSCLRLELKYFCAQWVYSLTFDEKRSQKIR